MAGNISISPFLFQRCFQQAWSGSRRARVNYGNTKYAQETGDNDILGLPRRFGELLKLDLPETVLFFHIGT
jgi:tRNA(Ile)-lysidine synthase